MEFLSKFGCRNEPTLVDTDNKDEIELDFEEMKDSTLRQLDAFTKATLRRKRIGATTAKQPHGKKAGKQRKTTGNGGKGRPQLIEIFKFQKLVIRKGLEIVPV